MTAMAQMQGNGITVGVDTHKDTHVAALKDHRGRHLAEIQIPTTAKGYADLLSWSKSWGQVEAFGVEGTGSYGKGLTRFLESRGQVVIEVTRPNRSAGTTRDKSDPADARAAARSVQAGDSKTPAKSGDEYEKIRVLRAARIGAVKARTQAMNGLKALVVTAPDELRERLRQLSGNRLIAVASKLRATSAFTYEDATKMALRSLAKRHESLSKEIAALEIELDRLAAQTAPELLAIFGVGTDVAGTLLVAAGGNPERLSNEGSFARLCGVAPIEASSGKIKRHRLSRSGNRQANSALHRMVLIRLRYDPRTQAYMDRRTKEGKSKAEIMRCLKRYAAREIFAVLKTSRSFKILANDL